MCLAVKGVVLHDLCCKTCFDHTSPLKSGCPCDQYIELVCFHEEEEIIICLLGAVHSFSLKWNTCDSGFSHQESPSFLM